jgi:hypothetical protein
LYRLESLKYVQPTGSRESHGNALRVFPRASPAAGVPVKTKLTKANVATLGLPEGKADAIHFDADIPGFGLRFRRGAHGVIVTWVLQHKRGRETLGRYPAISPQAAREWATKVHAQIALGRDPAAAREEEKQQRAETFEAVLRTYLPGKKLRPRSRVEIERHLLKNAASLHKRPIAQITQREIANCLAGVTERSGASQANRTRASHSLGAVGRG